MMARIGRYWHTVRHLRPIQIYGRILFRLTRVTPMQRPAPTLRAPARGGWMPPVAHAVSLIGPDQLRFLNKTGSLAEHGWDDPSIDKLWRYNLHYFDDLTGPASPVRLEWQSALLTRWVRENPPAVGTGWEPYPTSLRIVNWIKWAWAGNTLPLESVQSLAVQARWLARRLEVHLLGNHLFVNAKALLFAGLFFDGAEAEQWREKGFRILSRQVPEQILADGGQFERSPMYHALALEDMLDLCNLVAAASDAVPRAWQGTIAEWRARVSGMRHWLAAMCHPDGEVSFFNDCALGIAPPLRDLDAYAERLGFGARRPSVGAVTHLTPSGYVRVAQGALVALLDVGPVGPDYLPGHAHADTLSFELSLFGQRVLVNSGTSRYGAGEERRRQRGTAAHNTVVVDGQDSSEVWGSFRVARRARPTGLSIVGDGPITVTCAHDGYRRLRGRPIHRRQWTIGERTLIVEDGITGGVHRAEARLHLHPLVAVRAMSSRELLLTLPEGRCVRLSVERGDVRIEPACWHPEFGRDVPNACIAVTLDAGASRLQLGWDAA